MTDMKEMEKFTEVTVEDNVADKDVFNSDAPYDSGWKFDTNATSHTVVFEHKLNAIPTRFMIFFSADKETVYPLIWPWHEAHSGNPVTISANRKSITLTIFYNTPLHGVWTPENNWTYYKGGYWRVFAWR